MEDLVAAKFVQESETKVELPEFIYSYFKQKMKEQLTDLLDEFLRHFQTGYEIEWSEFVTKLISNRGSEIQKKEDIEMPPVDENIFQMAFDIMVKLNLRAQVKNSIHLVTGKVYQFGIQNNLDLSIEEEIFS